MARGCSSGKKSFKNYGDALNHMRSVLRKHSASVKLRNVYECRECGKWHMTSKSRHGRSSQFDRSMELIPMDQLVSYAFELVSSRVEDPTAMTAAVSPKTQMSRMFRAARLGAPNPSPSTTDGRSGPVAQNSSSARSMAQ